MKRIMIITALAIGFLLPARAQIVQTLNLKNGSQLQGYMKSLKTGNCTFYAEVAQVVVKGERVKSINNRKVAYSSLPKEWQDYAEKNNLLDKKKELTLSTIDTGAVINNVLVQERGEWVRYVELKHDYALRWKDIAVMEYEQRDDLLLSGTNYSLKVKEDGMVRFVTGQIIKKIPGKLTVILNEDGVMESIKTESIVKETVVPNNSNQTLFEQSILLDEVLMKDGRTYSGIIVEYNYEDNPTYISIREKAMETTLRRDDVAEYRYSINPDYVEVRDIELDPGEICVNREKAEQVKLAEEDDQFLVDPEMKRVTLKYEGKDFNIVIEANFKDSKEAQNNYLIKTKKFKKKKTEYAAFTFRDIIESNITGTEPVTSVNNTTKISYAVNAKGTYVFYNSGTKKAVVIEVQ